MGGMGGGGWGRWNAGSDVRRPEAQKVGRGYAPSWPHWGGPGDARSAPCVFPLPVPQVPQLDPAPPSRPIVHRPRASFPTAPILFSESGSGNMGAHFAKPSALTMKLLDVKARQGSAFQSGIGSLEGGEGQGGSPRRQRMGVKLEAKHGSLEETAVGVGGGAMDVDKDER